MPDAWHDPVVARIALLAHGAGSCPGSALRLLGPAVPHGVAVVAIDARGTMTDVVDRLRAAATGHDVVLAAGVSLGAHAVATWSALGGRAAELLLALPAWTGSPGDVAALTASSAADVRVRGRVGVLAGVAASAPGDWVVDELRRCWAEQDDGELADALDAAATSAAPEPSDLARIRASTVVVALADDPLHPVSVARSWAEAIPGARLVVVARHEPGRDRGALGRAGRAVLDASAAGALSGSR